VRAGFWPRVPASVRRFLRALHRDFGYVAVGLTFVYAASGIAVNHIADWDPNFTQVKETHLLPPSTATRIDPTDEKSLRVLADHLRLNLNLEGPIEDVYAVSETEVDVNVAGGVLHVHLGLRRAEYEGQKPRPLLRLANYLHTNRGKKAWTWVADIYAGILLYLATSGLFLLPLGKGLRDRKVWLVLGGVLVPVLYVTLSPVS
jgi:uncharacterized protein